ncbi:MAG: transglycosylase domain-containing protein [Acidobacteriota bacterium]
MLRIAAKVWRIARWGLVAVLLPACAIVQLVLVLVLCFPFDRRELAATAEPLVLLDVRGDEIVTLPAEGADRTHWTELGDLPAIAVSAVVESEDASFWDHHGIDTTGVLRALWLDAHGGRFGASTLTMQLARMLRGDNDRTIPNKVREALLALRIERALDKRAILEQWMNRAYFGHGAYGFDAAARLYFGKPARALSPGEATLLAVIPRSPAAYDPLRHAGAAHRRRAHVLGLLVERGVIDEAAAQAIEGEQLAIGQHEPANAAPHFTRWVLEQLPPEVRRAGGELHTTLDLRLQQLLEHRVREQVAQLHHANLEQAGVVVLDAQTTEVRAMVGSTSFADSQIDIVTRRRHPGSALKPFVYATAIEHGAAPTTIAWDTRDTSDDYFAPSTGVEHGPVRYREALASSYNFAAVDVLSTVGIARVMTVLRQAGVGELPGAPGDYGLRLALGAAKVRLLDLAAGYGFLVKGGAVGTPRGIAYAIAPGGARWMPARTPERRVFSPQTAWLVMDMLSDAEARRPGFGMELPFDLPFPIAAKTGTARGFADTWAIGATREVIVGAWAGTFDGTPMQGLVGMDAAAPLVRDGFLAVASTTGVTPTLPPRPAGIDDVEVCADTGLPADELCPRIHDHVAHGYVPRDPGITRDDAGHLHYPARARGWLRRTGRVAAN